MRLIEHKTALYGIQIFLRTNIDTDLYQSAENLDKCLEGQLFPRLWRCGGTRCTVGRPEADRIVAPFYDSGRAAAEDYRFALKL